MKHYYSYVILALLLVALNACKKEVEEVPLPGTPSNPTVVDSTSVNVDLSQVPYQTLSEYRFFVGDLKDMSPNEHVLPFEPITALFTDYASKKRFVWMPQNTHATYVNDHEVFNFPTGAVLIKHFYYTQALPGNSQKILETRLMIKQSSGWVFATYVWNEDQTEAHLNGNGVDVGISFVNEGVNHTTTYRIPSNTECMICHKLVDNAIPIGVKPMHLNKTYNYSTGSMNQLDKWIEKGYLNSAPGQILTLVDWKDASKSLNERVRSYIDINCAHCHAENKHCDYRPIRLGYNETINMTNLGLCVSPDDTFEPGVNNIITPMNPMRSMMHFRMNTNDEATRMPLIGRTMVHQEAVTLLEQYINTIQSCE